MFIYKRIISLFMVGLVPLQILSETPGLTLENDNSGQERMVALFQHPKADVAGMQVEKSIAAQAQNIVSDLNIPEITHFFECKTKVGHSYLETTLSNPLKKVDGLVAQRQQVIRKLVEDPVYKQQVEELLNVAAEYEKEAMVLLSDFFKGKTCPELKQLEIIKHQNPWMYPFIKGLIHNPIPRICSFGMSCLMQTAVLVGLYKAVENYDLIKEATPVFFGIWQKLSTAQKGGLAFYAAFVLFMESAGVYGIYKDCSTAAEKRTKMHALNRLIQISEQFEELAQQAGIELQNKFSVHEKTDANNVISGIKSSRYADKTSYCFAVPLVHTFLYSLYEQEQKLASIFASIAEMDAYNAIATKIVESRDKHNKFCFATYIESEKPAVEASGFWNVLVQNPVVNSMSEINNVILTGPNAGGKTTAIRALLQNITFAQTYGVAAAETFALTPFDVIHSYLNVSDDLINGLSLFASEVKRAQGIIETVKALQPGEKYFCALDELFTGTVAEDGETCAYQFVKRIAQYDTMLFVYATHFGKLTELETEQLRCINYKVDAPTKNATGKLVYPYTLTHGINDARVAIDLAMQANLFE